MKTLNSGLGQYLRDLRKRKGETLHQVAMRTDIDSPMLSKIERGHRMPTLAQLTSLSNYFQVSEEDLKVVHTAEKIIKDYGINETTYEAVKMVKERLISPYLKKNRTK